MAEDKALQVGYLDGHFAVKCPICGGLLAEFSADDKGPLWTPTPTVRCTNPQCAHYQKPKTYTRPSVELKDVDAQKTPQV